jgi:hypothetical protein
MDTLALVWLWCGFGVALVWLWCGLGVALVWLCTPESMPSICPVYGFVVALGGFARPLGLAFECLGHPELCRNGTLEVTGWAWRGCGGDMVGARWGYGGGTDSIRRMRPASVAF